MATNYIYKICDKCQGTGDGQEIVVFNGENKEYHTPENCDNCKGNGVMLWGYIEDELIGEE